MYSYPFIRNGNPMNKLMKAVIVDEIEAKCHSYKSLQKSPKENKKNKKVLIFRKIKKKKKIREIFHCTKCMEIMYGNLLSRRQCFQQKFRENIFSHLGIFVKPHKRSFFLVLFEISCLKYSFHLTFLPASN